VPLCQERLKKLPAFADRTAAPYPEAGQATSATSDPARMYLREIGKVPLLTAAEEVDLAMRIEGGELAAELLASVERTDGLDRRRFQQVVEDVVQIRAHQLDPEKKLRREGIGRETVSRGYLPRSRAIATSFLHRVAADVDRARGKLIEANLRLVVSIAKRHAHRGMPFLDLAQEGNLVQILGRDPDPEEIGRRAGLPAERVRQILELYRDPISLETPVDDQEDATLGDFIEDRDAVPLPDAASRTLLQGQLETVLHTLDDRERGIIQRRFGLLGGQPGTLEEIGRAFGVTRERIRQIESKTLCKLRHPTRAQQLRDYPD
jgi:RNA polymerase primary sigma factor